MSDLPVVWTVSLLCVAAAAAAAEPLPVGGEPAPVKVSHFPDRMHALIWRNWPVVPAERIAKVLATTPREEPGDVGCGGKGILVIFAAFEACLTSVMQE